MIELIWALGAIILIDVVLGGENAAEPLLQQYIGEIKNVSMG